MTVCQQPTGTFEVILSGAIGATGLLAYSLILALEGDPTTALAMIFVTLVAQWALVPSVCR